MVRLGVQFQKPPPAVQASLDRVVFALIRRKTEAKRPLQETSGSERRLAPRVELGEGDRLGVALLPDRPRGALSTAKSAPAPSLSLLDISTTGCALGCADPSPFQPGQLLRLRIQGAELDIEVVAKVLYQK